MIEPSSTSNSRAATWLTNSWPADKVADIQAAYGRLAHDADFQRVVEDLARYAGLRRSSFVPGAADQMAFAEGQRDLVLHLIEMSGLGLSIEPPSS